MIRNHDRDRIARRAAGCCTGVVAVAALMALAAALGGESRGEESVVFFVAPCGNDAWSGRLPAPNASRSDGPLATLPRARDAIRELKQRGPLPKGGVAVELDGGIYSLAQPLALTQEDSGTEQSPIVYRGRKGAEVRVIGGKLVTGWRLVTDPAVLARLDEHARGHVLQADLKAQGVADLGEMKPGPTWAQSEPGLELFFQNRPMTLARWPNEGFVRIVELLGPTPVDVRGTKGCREGIFTYEGDRPRRWSGAKDIMLHGYWFHDWADQRLKVESIDTEKRIITLQARPQHPYGFRKGQWYYAYNLLAELDQPGEWYLDRQTGILYFWPPAPIESGKPMISVLPNLVTMKDVSFVTLRGLILETCRGTAVTIAGGNRTRMVGCVIRNTGGWAVNLGGNANGVVGCDLYNLAEGGVSMSGGDRRTLTPAGLYVDNCHLFRFGRWNPICKPGVQVDGVGNRVTHNLFHDAPHMAVMWGGNDHLFEFNEFHSVVYGANDAGIMYAGYNPAMRGHMIRYNYFHHVYGHEGRGCNGVYLDDMFCSATLFGNVFCQVPRAAFIGGGHDNVVENNVFVDCTPALHVDARMMGWASASVPIMKQRLEEVPYKDEPWRSRYPQLRTYLDGNYAQPRGNRVVRNICWGGKWDEVEPKARPGVSFTDNLTGQDPRFVDAAGGNFQLRDDSPAWKLGFQRIPIEKIGLYASDDRASWPVRHEIRPKPGAPREESQSRYRSKNRGGLVVLQFDDGTLGHYTHAFRILEKYKLKGSFGVVTGALGKPGRLTAAQVAEMHRAGHEIHDHTLDHNAAFWGDPKNRSQWKVQIDQSLGILKQLGISTRGWNQPGGKGQRWTPELRDTLAPSYDYVAGRVGLKPEEECNMHWRLRDDPFCLGYGGVAFWNSGGGKEAAAKEAAQACTQIADGLQQGLVTISLWHVIRDEDGSAWGLEEVCKFLRAHDLPVLRMADAVRAVQEPRKHFGPNVEQMPNPLFLDDLDQNGRPDGYSDCRYAPADVRSPEGGRIAEFAGPATTWLYGPEPGRTKFTLAVRSGDAVVRTLTPKLTLAEIDGKHQYHWKEKQGLGPIRAGAEWQTATIPLEIGSDTDRVKIEFEVSPPGKVHVGRLSWRRTP